jgi:hypothetical protein
VADEAVSYIKRKKHKNTPLKIILCCSIVEPVYKNLLKTYLGQPDQRWWNDIVLRQSNVEQVNKTFWFGPGLDTE